MKVIKCVSEKIEDELDMAECLIKKAFEYKEEFNDISKALYSASVMHMDIVKVLHDQVVNLITTYRKEHGEPPAPMMAIYDYMHERHINKATGVKNMQDLYNKNF